MLFFQQWMEWRNWRWHSVTSAMRPAARSYTLRELLKSLETSRDSTALPSAYIERLAALVKEDLATAERFPERRGGPDTRRSLSAWRSRYNQLDRYLRLEAAPENPGQDPRPDDVGADALSAAENEGWPLPTMACTGMPPRSFRRNRR
jgi:hypothetical protein